MNKNIRLTLTVADTKSLIASMESLSDRLTKEWEQSETEIDKFVLISAIRNTDRLVQDLKEQFHFEKASLPA